MFLSKAFFSSWAIRLELPKPVCFYGSCMQRIKNSLRHFSQVNSCDHSLEWDIFVKLHPHRRIPRRTEENKIEFDLKKRDINWQRYLSIMMFKKLIMFYPSMIRIRHKFRLFLKPIRSRRPRCSARTSYIQNLYKVTKFNYP